MVELSAAAPAKINLALEILGRRGDGYHELRTILQTLALSDTVSLTLDAHRPGVTVTGPFADGAPADATNLAWRAAEELARRCGRDTGALGIRLDKHIPAAGGLGGGASDAATTLRLLQRAWNADEESVDQAANAVGSDEAFFLLGGTALVAGRGDKVTPLPALPAHAVVLFVPGATLERKTARLFQAVGATPFDDGRQTAELSARLPCALTAGELANGFERVAFDLFPGLGPLRDAVTAAIGGPVRLCGAGPTLFWIGATEDAERIIAAARNLDCTVIATETAGSQWAP